MDKSFKDGIKFCAEYFARDLRVLCDELLNDYAAYGHDPDTYFQDCFAQKLRQELMMRVHVLEKQLED